MSATNGKARRRLSAAEKLRILEEGRAPRTTVAEVLRRHQLDATTFYRWEREAKTAMLEALGERPRTRDAKDREIERLTAEVEKKSRVIAEVVEENLALNRGSKSDGTDAIPGGGECGWGVLMEIIVKARRANLRIAVAPTPILPRAAGSSKVTNVRSVIANLRQAMNLWWRLRRWTPPSVAD